MLGDVFFETQCSLNREIFDVHVDYESDLVCCVDTVAHDSDSFLFTGKERNSRTSDKPATSHSICVYFGGLESRWSSDCLPNENVIRSVFSVHGRIIGMSHVKAYSIYENK